MRALFRFWFVVAIVLVLGSASKVIGSTSDLKTVRAFQPTNYIEAPRPTDPIDEPTGKPREVRATSAKTSAPIDTSTLLTFLSSKERRAPVRAIRPSLPAVAPVVQHRDNDAQHARTITDTNDPRLNQILSNWEAAGATMRTAQAEVAYWMYDKVFEIDKRAIGRIAFVRMKILRMDLEPIQSAENAHSVRFGKSGKPFQVESMMPVSWTITPSKIILADRKEKTAEVIDSAGDDGTPFATLLQLANVFDIRVEQIKSRFDVSIISDKRDRLILALMPKDKGLAEQFGELDVMLDAVSFRPKALKFIDPTGNLETVYRFANWRVKDSEDDPALFQLNLNGYKINTLRMENANGPAKLDSSARHAESSWMRAINPLSIVLVFCWTMLVGQSN